MADIAEVMVSNPFQSWSFFFFFFFTVCNVTTASVVCINGMIDYTFISFSAVQIYELRYISGVEAE